MKKFFNNPIVQAIIYSGAVGPIIEDIISVPKFLLERAKSQFVYSVDISSETHFYEIFEDYLSAVHGDKITSFEYKMKSEDARARYTNGYFWENDSESDIPEITKAQSIGGFVIWNGGKSIFVQRIDKDKKSFVSEKYTLTCLFSKEPIDKLIADAIKWANNIVQKSFRAKCYIPQNGNWKKASAIEERDFNTIFSYNKKEILNDIDLFLKRREWYFDRGIPYRRGHLYEGPPGNGKTTFAKGLAYYTKRNVYLLPIDDVLRDVELFELVSSIPSNSILLLEDIDAFSKSKDRKKLKNTDGKKEMGVSLSGILNSLGGVISKENLIVIMTTNHPEDLDPALIREGRVDKRFVFDNPTKQEVEEYVRKFTGDENFSVKKLHKSFSYAKLQEICLTNMTLKGIKNEIENGTNNTVTTNISNTSR